MVNTGLHTTIDIPKNKDGALTMCQWRITSASWQHTLIITGVYRSPSTKDTLPLEDQMGTLQHFMTAPTPHKNGKHDAQFILGDLNAKTELTESILPAGAPTCKGFNASCKAGQLLKATLATNHWMIASHRQCTEVVPSRCWYTDPQTPKNKNQ